VLEVSGSEGVVQAENTTGLEGYGMEERIHGANN